LRRISTLLFCLHPYIIAALNFIFPKLGITNSLIEMTCGMIIILISTVFVYACSVKFTLLKKLY
ncbi:hypothetical protein KEJ63_09190, partial [Enterococcus faecium]|nr:hypothetical protein [Enterococcus faecium]